MFPCLMAAGFRGVGRGGGRCTVWGSVVLPGWFVLGCCVWLCMPRCWDSGGCGRWHPVGASWRGDSVFGVQGSVAKVFLVFGGACGPNIFSVSGCFSLCWNCGLGSQRRLTVFGGGGGMGLLCVLMLVVWP